MQKAFPQWKEQNRRKQSKGASSLNICSCTLEYHPLFLPFVKPALSFYFWWQWSKKCQTSRLWYFSRGVGTEPPSTILYEWDLLGNSWQPKLHEVWEAWQWVHEVEVEARWVRASGLQPCAILGDCSREVHGVCRGLVGKKSNASFDVSVTKGEFFGKLPFDSFLTTLKLSKHQSFTLWNTIIQQGSYNWVLQVQMCMLWLVVTCEDFSVTSLSLSKFHFS